MRITLVKIRFYCVINREPQVLSSSFINATRSHNLKQFSQITCILNLPMQDFPLSSKTNPLLHWKM